MSGNRESPNIRIEPYRAEFREAFRRLNEVWITTHFKLEKPDLEALGNPESYILDRGGFIFVALAGEQPVGVCALIAHPERGYELAKMAVAEEARGKKIGWMLGQAVISKAKELKAAKIYLESNTILKPAIALYEKLGFIKITGSPTPYERCNIQMELKLNELPNSVNLK